MSEIKNNIPKFASFRPTAALPVLKSEENRRRSTDKDESDTQKDRKHHRWQRQMTDVKIGSLHLPDLEQPAPRMRDDPPEIFIVDRKGDVKNLIYGSIHRYSIPPFRRSGAGDILGAPGLKIDKNPEDKKVLILSSRTHPRSNFREKYIFSKVEKERPRLLRLHPETTIVSSGNSEADYIPLFATRKKQKRHHAGESSGSDQDGADYRSIHGKATSRIRPADEEFQYATESESSGSETGRAMKLDWHTRQQTVELSREVERFPHDISAWIALINHQDALIRAEEDHQRVTSAEIRSTAEIKIHMYEKALENAKSLPDRERLFLGLMSEGKKIWDIKSQSERWEKISSDHIGSLLLWKSYVEFRQTTFSTFRYEEVREVFVRRIKLLSAALISATADGDWALHQQLIYVTLRFTVYVCESGHSELAVAIWQGLLEYHFFAPHLNVHQPKRTLFKEFWESEVPRIGEAGALGWSFFEENPSSSEPPEPLTDKIEDYFYDKPLLSDWAKAERSRSKASRLPARTMDEVTEDDPFRVILASDIEEFLVPLPENSENLYNSLLNAFLLFCRLPPIRWSVGEGSSPDWSNETFVVGDFLEHALCTIKQETSPLDLNLGESAEFSISSILETPVVRFVSSSESMFGRSWFRSFVSCQTSSAGDSGPISYRWTRTALQQLVERYFREDLGEYYLAFEWENEPNTIKKVCKGLIKQHPSSLRLYNAYALIEWSRGNREAAHRVFLTALDMSKSMPGDQRKDSFLLWKSWTWISLEDMDNNTALHRLVSMPDTEPIGNTSLTPAAILKARQYLFFNRDNFLSSGDTNYAIICAECLALLEYLSSKSSAETQSHNQGDISSALLVYNNFSQVLISRRLASVACHELLLQSAARLLYHHARVGPFRPALLREQLAAFMSLFPHNTIFLSLYALNESRLRIDNRVRSLLLSTVLTPNNDTLASRLFAIYYEISHGTVHSAQSAFEHALSSPLWKPSVGLWRLYILYSIQVPKLHAQVKDVWYRALRACPWAKDLYVLGFEKMGSFVGFEELKATWRVMGEKDLRVLVDLEDRFDEISTFFESNERGGVKRQGFR